MLLNQKFNKLNQMYLILQIKLKILQILKIQFQKTPLKFKSKTLKGFKRTKPDSLLTLSKRKSMRTNIKKKSI